jgi:hypothetical protein
MKCAIGLEADLEAGVVTGVIAALYVVVVNAHKETGRVEKKGASNDSPFIFIVAVKSLAQTCRVIRNSLNV